MSVRLRRPDEPDGRADRRDRAAAAAGWLQQTTSLMYLIGGGVLLYQYWRRLHPQVVLVAGILFVLYGACRFVWVRRTARR